MSFIKMENNASAILLENYIFYRTVKWLSEEGKNQLNHCVSLTKIETGYKRPEGSGRMLPLSTLLCKVPIVGLELGLEF